MAMKQREHIRKYGGKQVVVNPGIRRLKKKGKYRLVYPGPQVIKLAKAIERRLEKHCRQIEIAGSIRRKKPMPYDIDILIVPKADYSIANIAQEIRQLGGTILTHGNKRIESRVKGIKVDLIFTELDSWGAAMIYITGPAGANIWNRKLARKKGYLLNQYGLFDLKTGKRIASRTEHEIYAALGKTYRKPETRGQPR